MLSLWLASCGGVSSSTTHDQSVEMTSLQLLLHLWVKHQHSFIFIRSEQSCILYIRLPLVAGVKSCELISLWLELNLGGSFEQQGGFLLCQPKWCMSRQLFFLCINQMLRCLHCLLCLCWSCDVPSLLWFAVFVVTLVIFRSLSTVSFRKSVST